MTTPDLVVALRALLAEFRFPENGYWLTSACADRLEAVLTEHAPPPTVDAVLDELVEALRAGVEHALWFLRESGLDTGDHAWDGERSAANANGLPRETGASRMTDELELAKREVVAGIDAAITTLKGSVEFRNAVEDLLAGTPYAKPPNDAYDFEGLYGRLRNALTSCRSPAASRGGGDTRPPRQEEKQS